MKKILLTGSNGFLGRYITTAIINECNLYTLNRSTGDYKCDLKSTIPIFENSFDIVIHAACSAHAIPTNLKESKNLYLNNFNSTNNLLKALFKKPEVIIYISSVSVYGIESGYSIDESYPLLANDAYGRSKIDCEKLIINWSKKNNVKYLILRIPLLIGNSPKGNLKSMIKAIKFGYYLQIDNGCSRKSMLLAEDLANNILNLSNYTGIFNLTDGYHPSFNEIANIYCRLLDKTRILNINLPLAKILANIGDNIGPNFIFNSKKLLKITSTLTFCDFKARKAFNWKPRRVIDNIQL